MTCNWWNSKSPKSVILDRKGVWLEFMANMKELWDVYKASEGTVPPVNQPLFNINIYGENFEQWGFEETFENNWFTLNSNFALLYNDNFEWLEQIGDYSTEILENFENNWFIQVNYITQIEIENFDSGWFIVNDHTSVIFTETFEGVWD